MGIYRPPDATNIKKRDLVVTSIELSSLFVELGDGVGDVPVWCRDRAYVEFGF